MRHARLVIHRLHLDGTELPIRFGTVVAVARDDAPQSTAPNVGTDNDSGDTDGHGSNGVDWEVVADGMEDYEGAMQRHHVEALCIIGANDDGHLVLGELSGDAVVVRYVERTVVLRGDGPLLGVSQDMFQS